MIYSNKNITSEKRQFDWGEINQIALGETGRGRRMLALTCPPETGLRVGMNIGLSIGQTKSGKPKIIKSNEGLYLLLSSQGGYTRRVNGRIWHSSNDFELLADGNGADGDAGRIGHWDVVLLKCKNTQISCVQLRKSGHYQDGRLFYFVIHNAVYEVLFCDVDSFLDSMSLDISNFNLKIPIEEY